MFDGPDYPMPLEEEQFDEWLESGRSSKIGYTHLLIVWDALDEKYRPAYVDQREQIDRYELYPFAAGQESLIAVYDLYSEARISLQTDY